MITTERAGAALTFADRQLMTGKLRRPVARFLLIVAFAFAAVPGQGEERTTPFILDRVDQRHARFAVWPRYVRPELRAALREPVRNPQLSRWLRDRADRIPIGRGNIRLALHDNATVDAGGAHPAESITLTAIDIGRSSDLDQVIRRQFRVDPNRNYVTALLVSRFSLDETQTRSRRAPYFAHEATVEVTVTARDGTRVRLWRGSARGWTLVHDVSPGEAARKAPDEYLARLAPPRQPRHYGTYENVDYVSAPLEDRLYAGRQELLSTSDAIAAVTPDPAPAEPEANPQSDATPEASSSGEDDQEDSNTFTNPLATGVSGSGQPVGWSAYGGTSNAWGCQLQCSAFDCLGCCAEGQKMQQEAIFAASVACHVLSGPCFFCHWGCDAARSSAAAVTVSEGIYCAGKCIPSRLPLSNNPNSCPVE